MNKYSKSKSSLFLMELVIVILFFSICAAVCMQLFVQTHLLGEKTRELNSAVAIAQDFAETMRGSDGRIDSMLKYYPEAVTDYENYMELYYDDDFLPCEYGDAQYVSNVNFSQELYCRSIDIVVSRLEDDSDIYSLNASKYTGYITE